MARQEEMLACRMAVLGAGCWVLGRGSHGSKPRNHWVVMAGMWPVKALLLYEAQESLEWTLLEGEGGRTVGREDTHRAAGRRKSPEAVNPAG